MLWDKILAIDNPEEALPSEDQEDWADDVINI